MRISKNLKGGVLATRAVRPKWFAFAAQRHSDFLNMYVGAIKEIRDMMEEAELQAASGNQRVTTQIQLNAADRAHELRDAVAFLQRL